MAVILSRRDESKWDIEVNKELQRLWNYSGICLSVSKHRQTSNIWRTKSLNLNVSHLVLQLSLFNPLKPGVKSRTKK